ncbi:MAG: hypothetical protein QMB59_04915 [Bacteroidales bacterium]
MKEDEDLKSAGTKKPITSKKPAAAKKEVNEDKPKEKITLGNIFSTFFASDNDEA